MKVFGAILLLLTTFSLCLSQDAKPEEGGISGILYGEDHAYSVTAPKGWVLDNKAGVSQGLYAVFYPLGLSWQNAPAVMYTSVWLKDTENRTIDAIIANDIKAFRAKSDELRVTEAPAILIKDGKKALVRYFTGDAYGNLEAIAYIDEPKLAVIFVLTSKTSKDFEAALKPFDKLVKSYIFISDKVRIVPKEDKGGQEY